MDGVCCLCESFFFPPGLTCLGLSICKCSKCWSVFAAKRDGFRSENESAALWLPPTTIGGRHPFADMTKEIWRLAPNPEDRTTGSTGLSLWHNLVGIPYLSRHFEDHSSVLSHTFREGLRPSGKHFFVEEKIPNKSVFSSFSLARKTGPL